MVLVMLMTTDASTSGVRNSVGREGGGKQHSHGRRRDRREFSASLEKLTPVFVFRGHSIHPTIVRRQTLNYHELNKLKQVNRFQSQKKGLPIWRAAFPLWPGCTAELN